MSKNDDLYWSFKGKGNLSRREFLKIALGVSAGGLLASCTKQTEVLAPTAVTTQAPAETTLPVATTVPAEISSKRGGHLKLGMNGAVHLWDPAISEIQDERIATMAIYDGLTRYDVNMQPQPDLAESWDYDPDGLKWTFNLRQGVVFQHGKPFNADDVLFTYNRLLDPATKSPASSNLGYIDHLEKKDDYTVVFYLKIPTIYLPWDAAYMFMLILPSDRTSSEQIATEPSGTGAFKLKEWIAGEQSIFERNENYWKEGLPYLDGYTQITLPEETTRAAALASGEVDALWQINTQSYATLESDPNIKLNNLPAGSHQPINMRCDIEPFNDIRVRKAFKAVLDRDEFAKAVTMGFGVPAGDHPIPDFQLPELASELPLPKQDIELARSLLTEAGYPDGIEMEIWASPGRVGMVESAVTLKQMAEPAGIRLNINEIPIDTYWSEIWKNKELCLSNWATAATIDIRLSNTYYSTAPDNEAFFKSEELDKLIDAGRGENDPTERANIYLKAAKLIQEEAGSIIGYFRNVLSASRTNVHDFITDPSTYIRLTEVWKES